MAERRLLLVGESNPHSGDLRDALYHLPRRAAGDRLRQHMGLHDHTYAALEKTNLCHEPFRVKDARLHARQLLLFHGADVFVLLGSRVRDAFARAMPERVMPTFFQHARWDDVVVLSLPHPSGRCLLWNTPGTRQQARGKLRLVAPWVPWGEADENDYDAAMSP